METNGFDRLVQSISDPDGPAVVTTGPSWLDELQQCLQQRGYFVARVGRVPVRSKQDLLQALDRECQFPTYFGHNWDALHDCLSDFSWKPAGGYVLIYERPALLDPEVLSTFLDIVRRVSELWRSASVPFKLVVADD